MRRRRSMMKVCQNCQTENPADAVFCSSCGMGLTRARRPQEAGPGDITDRDGRDGSQMAIFMWGWVLLGMTVPVMIWSGDLGTDCALAGTLSGGLGAWMVWSAARRRGSGKDRIEGPMWAIGPITSGIVAAAGLAGGFLLIFAGTFCWDGGDCTQVAHFVLLLRGALFAAPLVGAIIVLADWLRRRSRSSEIRPGSE
jgi:ribosomal protein L40E